jgi:hypothetical protein
MLIERSRGFASAVLKRKNKDNEERRDSIVEWVGRYTTVRPSDPLLVLESSGEMEMIVGMRNTKEEMTYNIHLNQLSSAPHIPLKTSPRHQGIITLIAMILLFTFTSFFFFSSSTTASCSPLTAGTGLSAGIGIALANVSKINPNLAIINKLVNPLIPDWIKGDEGTIVEFNDCKDGRAAAYPGEIRVINRISRSGVRRRWGRREVRRWRWAWWVVHGGSWSIELVVFFVSSPS